MLPAAEELEEFAGADRLDLAAERLERVAVDARQQPALAPRGAALEASAEDGAVVLQLR